MEFVEPPAIPSSLVMDALSMDVAAAEEAAAAAKFGEIKAKLSADAKAMLEYNMAKAKIDSQAHIRKVMHAKEQNNIGNQ